MEGLSVEKEERRREESEIAFGNNGQKAGPSFRYSSGGVASWICRPAGAEKDRQVNIFVIDRRVFAHKSFGRV